MTYLLVVCIFLWIFLIPVHSLLNSFLVEIGREVVQTLPKPFDFEAGGQHDLLAFRDFLVETLLGLTRVVVVVLIRREIRCALI